MRGAILIKKNPEELRQILDKMNKSQLVKRKEQAAGKKNSVAWTAENEEAVQSANPFNIPEGNAGARKWAEEHLDLITSEKFFDWAKTPQGRKFLHDESGASFELYETLKEADREKEEINKIKREMTEKAGSIGIRLKKGVRTMRELKEELQRVKNRREQFLEREKKMPGYMYLRKDALKRMKETRERYRKHRKR